MTEESSPAGSFPPTLWTQIVRAQEGTDASRRDALDKLLAGYWRPVYASIRYGWSRPPDDARDLAQEFMLDLLERKFWEDIEPSRGRFRSFLKAALKNFMLHQVRDQNRLKRGGKIASIPVEDLDLPGYDGRTPDEVWDREWIATVLRRAIDRLRDQLASEGKSAYFEVLRRYDLEPGEGYADIARALGVGESDVRNYLHQARSKLRALIRETVLEYSADPSDVQEELRFILG